MHNKKTNNVGKPARREKANPDFSRFPPRPKPQKSSRPNSNRRNNNNP